MAISSQLGSVGSQSVTLPTVVVSLFSLPGKILALLPVLQVGLKGKLYILPTTQEVKTINASTVSYSQWLTLQALLLNLLFTLFLDSVCFKTQVVFLA